MKDGHSPGLMSDVILLICALAACLLFGLGVCPHAHLYPCFCLHTASRLAGVRYSFFSLYVPPLTVTCSPFLLIVLPPCQARESAAAAAHRKSSSLVFALRGKANSEMHKHRKRCFPHAGSSWASVTLLALSEIGNVSGVSARTCLPRPPPSRLVDMSPPLSALTILFSDCVFLCEIDMISCHLRWIFPFLRRFSNTHEFFVVLLL